ncbi:hypothetical protein P8F81_11275 [Kosakonia cowanii]|uniref:hypothetical protein n=1 Tax=Kosakonia cowanii TaxID=208223 RepID=UPI002DDC8FA6|nr:hypothetical protein [Kosakonia cowanii]WRY61527.1 hypothetical protein P8F81_11275 [Kosakonia cowanii]
MDPSGLASGLNTDTYLGGSLVRGEPLELMCDKTAPVDRVETDVVASQRIFISELGSIIIPDREKYFLNVGSKE